MKKAFPNLSLVCLFCLSTIAAGESESETRLRSLEERLARLEKTVSRLASLVENRLEKEKLAEATAELEALKAARPETEVSDSDQVTAEVISAPDIEEIDQPINVPYSGYMELHLNNDGINPTTLDFHRFVLLFGHGFGSRIRFWSEVELEHAFVEGGEESGEIELEQAYLDFLIDPRVNFRAGMLLTPVGIINERHEPPSFNGVERPFVDTVIIPTTWFGSGAGLVGDLGGGFSYRAYAMSSLNGLGFSAEEGFREGRQKGFFENARNVAWTARLEYRGIPGLDLGTSFWTGETGFEFRDIDGRANIFEFDGRFQWRRLEGRGQFVFTDLDDAAAINTSLRQRFGISPNIAEQMRGFYLEGGARILPSSWRHNLVAFYRYENFDTQFDMPAGFLPLKQFDRSAHIFGVTYYPYPDVALKFDYNVMRNESLIIDIPNRWNAGIGWWF